MYTKTELEIIIRLLNMVSPPAGEDNLRLWLNMIEKTKRLIEITDPDEKGQDNVS